MIIYGKNGTTQKAKINRFTYNGTFMGESYLMFNHKCSSPIQFEINDYCEYRGERYILNNVPSVEKVSSDNTYGEGFIYDSVKFESLASETKYCSFLDYVPSDNLVHRSSMDVFSFYGTVRDLCSRIKANLDRLYVGDKSWTINIDPSVSDETKDVNVSMITCMDAINLIKSTFDVNYIIRGRVITVGSVGINAQNVFGYGKGNGLRAIKSNVDNDFKVITRLRVYGGTDNIPYRWYNKQINPSTSQPYIPNSLYVTNLMLPSFLENGGDSYIDSFSDSNLYDGGFANTTNFTYFFDGNSASPSPITETLDGGDADDVVSPIDIIGTREASVYFDGSDNRENIHPTIKGMTYQQLVDAGVTITKHPDDDGNLDEIYSCTNPSDSGILPDDGSELDGSFVLYLKDLGFDLSEKDSSGNYIYASTEGEIAISITSGLCAGRSFTIAKNGISREVSGGVVTYRLTCLRDNDEGIGMAFPNNVYRIESGDTFVIVNIQMPDVYVKAAMQKLLSEGLKYLSENNKPKRNYELIVDNIYMANNPNIGYSLKEGDKITFEDLNIPVSDTIIIKTLEIEEGNSLIPEYKIVLSNDITVSTINQIIGEVNDTQLEITEVKNDITKYVNRNFKDIIETANALDKAFEDFSDGINPSYVNTLSLIVGTESQQFNFVNSNTTNSPTIINFGFQWNNANGTLDSVSNKYLKHLTLGITDITPSSYIRDYTAYKFWYLPRATFANIDGNLKYVYAKCNKSNISASYIVSDTPFDWKSDPSYYYFLIGIINSQKDGNRSYTELYGYTEILPSRVTTEKIISSNGLSYIDLGGNKAHIGDSNSYIDWNNDTPNAFKIKGVIAQSQSGDEFPIGVYRGNYNASYTYYKGDTVFYNGSTWIYINNAPSASNTPSVGTYWNLSSQKGDQGDTGSDGDYFENRYAVNGSPTVPPPLVTSDPNPSGWSTTLPTQALTEYTWFTSAKKTSSGSLVTLWSTPQRVTGVKGENGSVPSNAGIWSPSKQYYGTNLVVNIVFYSTNSLYYVARSDVGAIPIGTLPTDTNYWNVIGATFDSIATGLLLAQTAYIENLIVGKLGTTTNPYASRLASLGSSIGVFKNLESESAITNASISMGSNVTDQSLLGKDIPALRVRDVQWMGDYNSSKIYYKGDRVYYSLYNNTYVFRKEWTELDPPTAGHAPTSSLSDEYWYIAGTGNLGGGSYSEVSSSGLFSNGSDTQFLPTSSSIKTNASGAFLLFSRNSDPSGLSAAVYGSDRTSTSDGVSKSYGGYFDRLRANGFLPNIRTVSGNYNIQKTDFVIHSYANVDISLWLPIPDVGDLGLTFKIRMLGSNGWCYIRSHISGKIWHTSPVNEFRIGDDDSVTVIWDGNYWVTYFTNQS